MYRHKPRPQSKHSRQRSAARKQAAYEAARRAWRADHPLVPGSAWTPPPGHPREREFQERGDV
jgi:hypothetical protein